jgi:4-oxalomesaconate tautomerase
MMRGGTSKGAYFLASDLPVEAGLRDRVLLAALGASDARQVDGIGGGHPLTSKVAIVSRSTHPGADVDYLFAQVVASEARVDTAPTCGNILAGVGPFALEQGLVRALAGETRVRIHMVNTGSLCEARICTPGAEVTYDGEATISGGPGSAAPVLLTFVDTAGSSCGALLPTGRACDTIDGIAVTCIDNGMPVVIAAARDLGVDGYASVAALNADAGLKARLESLRLAAGARMNLGDVRAKVVPKMTLVAAPRAGGSIATRTFIPHVCHEAIGVLGAVSVATACVLPGSAAASFAQVAAGRCLRISVEHPSGEFTVELATRDTPDGVVVEEAALLRTARPLFEGHVLVPGAVWDGAGARASSASNAALVAG